MKTLGFHHVALQARDVAKVAAFYCDVLQLPELARHHHESGALRSIWVGVGAAPSDGFLAIEAAASLEADGTLGYSMVALRIAPMARDETERMLASRSVAIERRSKWTIYVRDPEGNLVGLSHHPYETRCPPKSL